MKKLCLLFCLVAFGYFSQAQGLKAGFKIGPSFANITGKDANNKKMLTGLQLGAFGSYQVTDMFSGQIEINYEDKGYKNINPFSTKDKIRFAYLVIPMLAKASFDVADKIGAYGIFGPYFGFLLGVKCDGQKEYLELVGIDPTTLQPIYVTKKYKDGFKSFDLGLVIGGGATYEIIENLSALFDLRVNMGLLKIIDASNNNKVKNFTFGFAFGAVYVLPFGG